MRRWDATRVAAAAGATLLVDDESPVGPGRVVIDSREAGPGDLFVGLAGERVDGSAFAEQALVAGAWGVLTREAPQRQHEGGAVLVAADPLAALKRLASAWREELGARVAGITGSTGKTSTKDILAALLRPHVAVCASPLNLNTEIGLPLAILAAPQGTEVLVLEMAMRGPGQIAELAAIARPDVGVIVNVGPAHLELLGSLEAIAAAKAELLEGLAAGAVAVIPAGEPLLEPHLREDVRIVRFGPGGDVRLLSAQDGSVRVDAEGEELALDVPFSAEHQLLNLLAAVAAARALGVHPEGAVEVEFSGLRGEVLELPGGLTVIDDCYNANPMSMRAALHELARTARGRRVAVLGEMLELGPAEERFHRELGVAAREAGVELLVTVGPRARATSEAFGGGEVHHAEDAGEAATVLAELVAPGDTVLVKGSRGVGLEVVARSLVAGGAAA
jgi:UDP-N-acetylmuramoyl-tripeptide--D-alanyl-D-alanine ligase